MNVLGAFFLGQAGDRFEVFQFVFVFLNLLPFLACCLLMPALAGRRKRLGKWAVLPLAGIFAMSPLIMENATYTWTKALAAFFVILAIWPFTSPRSARAIRGAWSQRFWLFPPAC